MLTVAAPLGDRFTGWSMLPVRCPHCERRMKQQAVVLHGGVLHCPGCNRGLYVILAPGVQLAFVAEIHPDEVKALHAQGANAFQVLAFLGATIRAA